MQKNYLGILVLVLILIGGIVLFSGQKIDLPNGNSPIDKNQVFCPQDARGCPDGSFVGRVPPNCEFAKCPEDTIKPNADCDGKLTPQLTEGPYYKTGSPQRSSLIEEGVAGEKITVTGFVFNQNCEPIANVFLDFWQTDGTGVYDNTGYKLRGHQFTNSEGKYILETVVPAQYSGRTPHIHVKVRASENSPVLTSQLFLPGESGNEADSIFNQKLIMDVEEAEDRKIGVFNFVISD